MNVFCDTTMLNPWKVKVDDMHDILNIQTASRNPGSHKDGALCRAECTP